MHEVGERRAHQGQRLLRQFREGAQDVQLAELEKALRDLRNGQDAETVIRQFSHNLTNKLIHQPTVAIRTASADGRMDHLEYLKFLYQLD